MGSRKKKELISMDAFLKREAKSEGACHEYVDGKVLRMHAPTVAHETICINLIAALYSHVDGSGCRVFSGQMMIKFESENLVYHPDVMVTCEPFGDGLNYVEDATLIVEVLSPSTSARDRLEKFAAYRKLQSVREFLLIHQKQRKIELYRRTDDWALECFTESQLLTLLFTPKKPFHIGLDAIYTGLSLPPYRVKDDAGDYIWDDKERCFIPGSELQVT